MAFQTPARLTCISADDALIKVYGVVDNERYQFIENILNAYSEKLHTGLGLPQSANDLMPGKVVLAYCAASGQYRRALIICSDTSSGVRKLLVKLIDTGASAIVEIGEIRCIESISHLAQVPDTPLAVEYILFGCIRSRPWSQDDIEFANRITLLHTEVTLVGYVSNLPIINITLADKKNRVTFTKCLADKGCVALVQAEQQKAVIQNKYEVKVNSNQFQVPPPGFSTSPTLSAPAPAMSVPSFPYPQSQPSATVTSTYQPYNTTSVNCPRLRMAKPVTPQPAVQQQYILDTLPVGSTHEVYVSHVIDGMQNFTIQIKKNIDDKLTKLMAMINDTPPEPFTDPLQPGTVCLGRYSADESLCRAVVSTVLAEGANLYFVDFGNSEIVSFDEIYKMPPMFMQEKVMAIRFTLANLNNYSLTTQEAQDIFRELVLNGDSLIMHVTRPEMPLKQYCELSMIVNGKPVNIKNKILDKVKLMKPAEYQKIHFKQGNTTDVIVSYIESPIRFFVQLELNQSMLELLMISVEEYCTMAENKEMLYVEDVNENMAVCAQYSEDQKWYRGLIIDEPDANGNVAVFFVDYGNQEDIHFSKLRIMNNEMISKFPMQAIECRLSDVDADLAVNPPVIDHFVNLVDGNSYQMKVLNVLPAHVLLVELIDDKRQNVKDILLQLAAPPPKEPSPASDYSSGSRGTVSRQPSQGNWRERNNSGSTNDNFSAFKREDSRDGQRFSRNNYADSNSNSKWRERNDVDETDDVAATTPKQDDFWADSKKDRYPPRGDEPYFKPGEDRRGGENRWQNRDNESGEGRRPYKPREDSWSTKDSGGGSNWHNRDNDGGGRKPYQRREDSDSKEDAWKSGNRDGGSNWSRDDGGGRKPYQRREDSDSKEDAWKSGNRDGGSNWSHRDDGGGRRPYQRREDSESGNRDRGSSWNNRDGDGGGRKPYQKREDSSWNSEAKTDDWTSSNKTDGESNWSSNRDSDRKPYQKRQDSWNSEAKTDDWTSGNKTDGESRWNNNRDNDRKPYQRRDDTFGSKPWEKPDRGGRSDSGFKSRSYDSGGSFGSSAPAVTLEPAFEKGAQFVAYEHQPGQQLEVAVSWFINPAQFYVIPAEDNEFRMLMESIQTAYPKRERLDITTLSTDDCIVARDSDNVIYRARVIHGRPGGVLVNFVDYGNSSLVRKDQVWAVSQDHCVVPVQATSCGLHNISTLNENTAWPPAGDLEPYFNKDKYSLTFVACDAEEKNSKTWLVNLTDENGQDVGDLLVAAGVAAKKSVLQSEELYEIDIFRHQILTVYPGHVESSKKFFVHIDPPKVELIRQTIEQLMMIPQGLIPVPVEQIIEGEFCLARSEDESYYRALILSTDPTAQTAHVWYIDYGDENDVAFDLIKVLPENLMIYSSQIVECSLFEGDSFEDEEGFANAIADSDFMIRVMDVVDNKLQVHVFDVNGSRLPYPVAIEETIPMLCPLPVLKCNESVVVSHVTKEKVYLQRVADETYILDQDTQLAEFYEAGEQEKVAVEADQFYAAKSGRFETWYRCKPIGPECQEVFYIDYGNTEPVEELISIRPLDKKFFASPAHCIGVSCLVQFTAEDLTPISDAVQDTVFAATFESTGPNEWLVDLKCESTGKTLAEFAVETNCGSVIPPADDGDRSAASHEAFDGWQLDTEKRVIVCHVDTPEDFFVRKSDDLEKVTRMQDSLQSSLKKVLPLIGSAGPQLVAAQNSVDCKWYRARVTQKDEIFAVDFGFTLTSARLKRLPRVFTMDTSNYIIGCSLNLQPAGESWEADAIQRFREDVAQGAEVMAKLEFIKGDKKFIDLKVDGTSLSDLFVNEGVAKWKSHEVVVTHANSLKAFFVQDCEREDDLFALIEKLQSAAEWEVAEPAINDVVAGQFVDDEQWYRAVVTRIEEDGVKVVQFIDYGNESPCTEFRTLPNELKSVPAFATCCTLTPLPENAVELDELFVEFVSAAVEGTYSIYILSGVQPMPVMLEFNGKPIEDVLVQKKTARESAPAPADVGDSVIVSHINSPSSFYVQSDSTSTEQVEAALAEVESTAPLTEFVVGDLVAAKFPEDGLWYRAIVTEVTEDATTVVFIDYGNSSVVDEVRPLADEARTIRRLAKHCAIPFPVEMQQWPEVASVRFSELACDGNTVFRITIKEDGDPAVVDLQDNGTNVADELTTLCKADLTAPVRETNEPFVCLSHVQSVHAIWIQFQTLQIDEMTNEMANADTFDELTTAEEGQLVAAQFDDDALWYRAKVLRQLETGHHVLFIDYGNESEVSLVKSLPEDLVNLPPLAKCCRLKDVSAESDEITEKLNDLVLAQATFMVSELIEEDDGTNVVALNYTNDGRSLTLELLEAGAKVSQDDVETEPADEVYNEETCVAEVLNLPEVAQNEDVAEIGSSLEAAESIDEVITDASVNGDSNLDSLATEEFTATSESVGADELVDDTRAYKEALADDELIGFGKPNVSRYGDDSRVGEDASPAASVPVSAVEKSRDGDRIEPQSGLPEKINGDSSKTEDLKTGAVAGVVDGSSEAATDETADDTAAAAKRTNECEKTPVHVPEYENDNIAEDESDKYATPSSMTTEDYVTPERLDASSESDVLNTSFCETSSSPTDIVEAVENEHGAQEDQFDEFSVSGDVDHQASASVDYNISLKSGAPANVVSIDALSDTDLPASTVSHSLEPSLEDPPITVIEIIDEIVADVDSELEASALPAIEEDSPISVIENTDKIVADVDSELEASALPAIEEDPSITVIENTIKIVVDFDNELDTSALTSIEKAMEAKPVNEDLESPPAAKQITEVCGETSTFVEIESSKYEEIESVSPESTGYEVPENMTSESVENDPGESEDPESSTSADSVIEEGVNEETLTTVEKESSKDTEVDSSPTSNGTEVSDKTAVKVEDNLSEIENFKSSSPVKISDDKTSATITETESVENENLESFLPLNSDIEVSDDDMDVENKPVENEDPESSSSTNNVIVVSTPAARVEDQRSENEDFESSSSATTVEVFNSEPPIAKVEPKFGETDDLESFPAVRPLTEICNETLANVEKQSITNEGIESLAKSSGIEVPDNATTADIENKSNQHECLKVSSPANTVVELSGDKTLTTKDEDEPSKTEDLETSSPASTIVASDNETFATVECIEIEIGGLTPADFVARHSDYQIAAEMECEHDASKDSPSSSPAHVDIGVSNTDITTSVETESSKTEDLESSLPANLVTSVIDVTSSVKSDSESSESGEFDTCSSSVSAVILETDPAAAPNAELMTANREPDEACEVLASSPSAAVSIQATESHEYPPEISSPTETATVDIPSVKTTQKSNEIENESSSAKDTATEVTDDETAKVKTKSIETRVVRASASKRPVLMTTDACETEKRPKLAATANGDLREASFPQTDAGECVYDMTSTNGVSEAAESDLRLTPAVDALIPAKVEKELALEDCEFVMTCVNTPSSFYLRKVSDSERLKIIETSLRHFGTSEPNELENPEIGQLVAVKRNSVWLRAKIEQVDDFRGFMLFCIDYGMMSSDEKVFQLPEELRLIPPLAIHCAFQLPVSVEGWSDNACQKFFDMTLIGERIMTIKIVNEEADVKYVELFDQKGSITEKIIALCNEEDEVNVQ